MKSRLVPARTVVVFVDVQERLFAAMDGGAQDRIVKRTTLLAHAAKEVGAPCLVTLQYPKGLGPTIAPLTEGLAPLAPRSIEKLSFDATKEPSFTDALHALAPETVVLAGMEAHVCVFLTARSLVARGFDVVVAGDAVASRREEDRSQGLALAQRVGAWVAPSETIVFDWLERAGTPAFKAISPRIR
jgi:nicotinamidase-related amidase